MALKIQSTMEPEGEFPVAMAEHIEMPDGKKLSEVEFVPETLLGNTSDTTPFDVGNAMVEGKNILINHTDSTYGLIFFANFSLASTSGIIAASVTFEHDGATLNASLTGDIEAGTWTFSATELAKKGDAPKTPTEVDLSGYESGTIVETYSDGSVLTYTLTFDEDGNITKIVDSNGNETVLTW